MSTKPVRVNDPTSDASVARVDMKFEIVVIPVSDVDRAKEFYGRLGWRLDADYDNGKDFRVIQSRRRARGARSSSARTSPRRHPAPPRACTSLSPTSSPPAKRCSIAASRSPKCSTTRPACTRARTSPTCLDGSGSAVRMPSIAATGRSLRSATRTATAGCSRKSPRGCRVASTP